MFFYPTAAGQQPMMFAAPMTNTTPGTDAPQPTMMPFTTSVPTNTNSTNQNNTNTNTTGNEKGSNTNTSNPNSSTSSLFPPQATGAGAIPMAMPVPMTAVPFSLNLSPGTMTNGVTTDSIPPATSNVSVSGAASFQTGFQPVVTSPDGSGLLPMSSMATATTAAPGVSVPNLKTSNTNTNTNDNNNNLSTVLNSTASPPSYEAVVLDPNGPRSQTNLFVRKLASAVTEKDVQSLFEPFGRILSFGLMRNIHTGEPLGTAFVRFAEHEQAKAAMEALEGKELYGRSISIQWAKKHHDGTPVGEARQKIHKVFVRNVPLDISGKELRAVFAPHGAISNVTLHDDTAPMTTADGQSVPSQRNIAFIVFHDDGAAESAVKVLHNTCPFPSCNGIPLMVKLAEDNRQRLERKHKLGESLGTVHTNSSTLLPPNISDTALVEMSHRLRTPEVGTLTSAQGSAASPTLQMTNNSTTSPGTSIPFLNPQQQQQQQMMMQGLPPGAMAVPGGFMFPVTMQPQQMNAANNNNNNNSNNNNNNSTQQQQQPFFYPYMPQPVPSGNNSGGTSGGMPMYAYPQFFFPNQQQQQQPQFFVTTDASGNQVSTPTPMFFAPMPPQMNASGNNNNNNNMQMQPQPMYFTTAPHGQPQPMMMMPFPMMQPQQQMGYNTNMSANTTNHTSSGLRSVNNSPQTTSLSGTPAQNTFSVVASNSPGNVDLSKGGAAAKTPVVPNPAAPSATLVGSGAGMMGMPVLMSAANNHGTTNAFSSGALNNNDNNSTQNVTANAGKSVSSLMPPRMSSMPDFTSLQQKSLLGGTQGSATKGKSTQQHPQQRTHDGEEEEDDALFSNIGTNLEVGDEDGIVGNDSAKAGNGCDDKKGSNTAAAANQNASTADDDEDMVAYTQDLMERFRLRTSTNSSDGINPTTN